MKNNCIMCGNEVPVSGKLPQKVTWNSFCKRCDPKRRMEPIIYPTEHKMQTAQRVTYNAEVTKFLDGQKLAKISASDLTNETLRKLLLDITGLSGKEGE